MSFQPVIPLGGLAGWAFLSRTQERQQASFADAPAMRNDVAYFRDRFDQIGSAQELVSDRRVLRVVLGAFGLHDDLDSRAFIGRIIEDGVSDPRALANRLTDKRYAALARAMQHLAPDAAQPAGSGLRDHIITRYQARSFELAVGEQDQSMRIAMNLQRELPKLLEDYSTENARWFALLGNPPLRKALETALGLPREFAALDVDQQVSRLKAATRRQFGAEQMADLTAPDALERLTQRFLVMSQINSIQNTITPASVALTLLRGE
ncbi:MAG: DUF1217 domain-containing protein [Rhodobacteraceae bacterium]|nr:DUF1217 domain-containing protein [Paracoccaceae bacterium]